MQRRRMCALAGVLFSIFLSGVSLIGQDARQPQVSVETFYPRHAAAGRTTVISIAVPRGTEVKGAEIAPAAGVTVAGIKGSAAPTEQAIGWWDISLAVAQDAAPGDRSLALVLGTGRTVPVTISIPTHVPAISELRVTPQSNQSGVELQVTAIDSGGDLGDSPYVWFSADCGGDPIVGTLRSTVTARVVHAALPDLRTAAASDTTPDGTCDLQVRLTDAAGIDSNTLKTTLGLRK